jgi:hypothetical protein
MYFIKMKKYIFLLALIIFYTNCSYKCEKLENENESHPTESFLRKDTLGNCLKECLGPVIQKKIQFSISHESVCDLSGYTLLVNISGIVVYRGPYKKELAIAFG